MKVTIKPFTPSAPLTIETVNPDESIPTTQPDGGERPGLYTLVISDGTSPNIYVHADATVYVEEDHIRVEF